MARIPLIAKRNDANGEEQRAVFDAVVASRGKMIRPFQVLAHVPSLAGPLSELGATIRFAGTLSDRDRELVILTAAMVHRCEFEWSSHLPIAIEAGVSAGAIERLRTGAGEVHAEESLLIDFVSELCDTGSVSQETFERIHAAFGDPGTVELATIVGYYTLLAFVMGTVDAC